MYAYYCYLPLKNISSPRRVVIASNVKLGSQACGVTGPVGCTAALDSPIGRTFHLSVWRNIKTVFRRSLRTPRTFFTKNEKAYGFKLKVCH